MKLYKTSEQIISKNYPYGFRLRTTKTDYIEFSNTRGFRHCSFTINPKTGKQNNPKKSTYYEVLVLGIDEVTGYTKSKALSFYDHNDIDNLIAFFSVQDNFELFTSEQMTYIYRQFLVHCKVNIQAQVTYCGSKPEDLFPLFNSGIDLIIKGVKEKGLANYFSQIKFDWVKIDSFEVEGYQPCKVTHYRSV